MDFSSSRCVVTGATEGIGRAIALALGKRGGRVALCSRSVDRVDATVRELAAEGLDVMGATCDVSDDASITAFAERVLESFGSVDVLVNNAGLAHFGALSELTRAQIDAMLNINLRGLILVTRAFLPGMLQRRSGHIVNIASLAGRNPVPRGTVYAASKHAVLGFSKSLMQEVRQANVRVLAVCPGSVETPFFGKAGIELKNADRVLQPQDVAHAVVSALELPDRALISELDIRPANP